MSKQRQLLELILIDENTGKENLDGCYQATLHTHEPTPCFLRPIQSSPSSTDVLVEALREIESMKRLPGETTDNYAFNRCWHIASNALKQYNK